MMTEMKFCPHCQMEYDWPGVAEAGEEFCCAECARGERCSCVQHEHRTETTTVDSRIGKSGPP